jgi:hypothetical protein
MSEELIYENLYSVLAVADSILQIWLTVTFAVLVAAYVAGNRITRYLYLLINFLYGFAALILAVRFVSAAYQIYYYRDLLVTNGFAPWPVPRFLSAMIGGGTLILLVGGSIATLWFIHVVRKRSVMTQE